MVGRVGEKCRVLPLLLRKVAVAALNEHVAQAVVLVVVEAKV